MVASGQQLVFSAGRNMGRQHKDVLAKKRKGWNDSSGNK